MTNRLKSLCFALSLLLLACWALPSTCPAHSLYIQSSRYHVHKGKSSPLFFCYGHHIPVDDGVRVHTPAGEVRDVAVRDETCLHSYMVDYDAPGTYVLFAETNPGFYTMYIDTKGRERHTIKPMSAIADQAREIITSLRSKQFTKTYVVCEEPSAEFPARVGLDLELVPTRDVSTLKAGDELELKVHFNGEPYTGQGSWDATYLGFSSTEAEDTFHPRTEVNGDTVRVPVPNAGRWYVRYFIKVPAQGEDAVEYTHMKYTTTLIFEIPNERKTAEPDSH